MKNRGVLILIVIGMVAAAVAGGFFLYKRIQHDREAVLSYIPPNRPQPLRHEEHQTVTYTEKDLEEMRKKGVRPPIGERVPMSPSAAGESAAQRSMRTLDEVNRINEMNRRNQEQQERMRNQK